MLFMKNIMSGTVREPHIPPRVFLLSRKMHRAATLCFYYYFTIFKGQGQSDMHKLSLFEHEMYTARKDAADDFPVDAQGFCVV